MTRRISGGINLKKARKEIEIEFGLVKAEDSKKLKEYLLKPLNIEKLHYGKSETRRGITNVPRKLCSIINTLPFPN